MSEAEQRSLEQAAAKATDDQLLDWLRAAQATGYHAAMRILAEEVGRR
jgi:hypothetical protein